MPAVELLKLRTQIRKLIDHFGDPDAFRSELKDLLDLYSNRAYRAGTAVKPQPLLPSYRVTPLIMRELEIELTKVSHEQPQQALYAAEILWQDSYLEPRLIGSILLGAIPVEYGESVVEKLREWSHPDINLRILDTLFQNSTTTLRRNGSMLPLRLAEDWITSSQSGYHALGIRLLIPIIQDIRFENLPPVFRLLSPLVQNIPPHLQADLPAIIEVLIRRSPAETGFFLRQTLPLSTGQNTARLIRRCLPFFEPEQQAILKQALRATNLT